MNDRLDRIIAAALDRAAADFVTESARGRLLYTTPSGTRAYSDDSAGRLTLTTPGAPTLVVDVVGVNLAVLR